MTSLLFACAAEQALLERKTHCFLFTRAGFFGGQQKEWKRSRFGALGYLVLEGGWEPVLRDRHPHG